jgi:hypothetical protein
VGNRHTWENSSTHRFCNDKKSLAFFNNTLGKHSEALKIPNFGALERDPRFRKALKTPSNPNNEVNEPPENTTKKKIQRQTMKIDESN